MFKAILVDDEKHALDALRDQLEEYEQVSIVAQFTNPLEAIERLDHLSVNTVFLDIEMPGMTGLELAEHIMEHRPGVNVVFVTAYDQYAVEAFEVNALDYLLKPVRVGRISKTIQKLMSKKEMETGTPVAGGTSCEISTFGAFQIRAGSELVTWRTNKVRELFAYLVHYRGRSVNTARIIDDLWPDMDIKKAYAYLYTCIYQVRKTIQTFGLEEQIKVRHANRSYMLELRGGVSCDADDLSALAKAGVDPDDETAAEWERMVELYRGDYLDQEDFPWAYEHRAELTSMYEEQVMKLVRYYLRSGKLESAVRLLDKELVRDPLEEKFHELLLQIYAHTGNQSALMRHYHEMKELFMRELGVGPSHTVETLIKRMVEE